MIRQLGETAPGDGRALYGLTLRGVAWLGLEAGVVIASLVLAVTGLSNANQAIGQQARLREETIGLTCREANERHAQALVSLRALAAANPSKGQTSAQQDAVVRGLVDALAPSYDCAARVRKLTRDG